MFEAARVTPRGTTRSKVTDRYALMTTDTFVTSVLVGWTNTRGVVQISPRMGGNGAEFLQYEAHVTKDSIGHAAPFGVQRFVYVLEGQISIGKKKMREGGYAYLPTGFEEEITTAKQGRVLVIEKTYSRLEGT